MNQFKWYRKIRGGFWCKKPSGHWFRIPSELWHTSGLMPPRSEFEDYTNK